MDIGLIFTILGTILTLGFGVFSFYTFFKGNKYPGKLSFQLDNSIDLYDEVVKNFNELIITFKGKEINKNFNLLRGYLINSGNLDISSQLIENRVKLILPKSSEVHDAKVIGHSNNLKVELIKSDNSVIFDMGLFRKNEFIHFEILSEVPESIKKVEEQIKFEHRIANTSKIKIFPKFSFSESIGLGISFLVIIVMLSFLAYNEADYNKIQIYDLGNISFKPYDAKKPIMLNNKLWLSNDSTGLIIKSKGSQFRIDEEMTKIIDINSIIETLFPIKNRDSIRMELTNKVNYSDAVKNNLFDKEIKISEYLSIWFHPNDSMFYNYKLYTSLTILTLFFTIIPIYYILMSLNKYLLFKRIKAVLGSNTQNKPNL
ncbi:MAG: hypothetical protein GC192_13565 [Bacteroidetes bacterium]|nr:hypothetical protein [Bacteroidota bacterium]